jgi:hypothetical protein
MRALSLLVISAGGARFGLPLEQVAGVGPVAPGDEPLGVRLGLAPVGTSKWCVTTRTGARFAVEEGRELLELPKHALRRLPSVLRSRALPAAIGAALLGDGLLVVLDLERLP